MAAPIMIESPNYAMTGRALCWIGIRREYEDDTVQPLDAPQFIARGSLQGFPSSVDARKQYVSASDLCMARAGL